MTDALAETLAELAEYLKLDGQEGLSRAYGRASDTVLRADHIPADPARLDGIGPSFRDDIAEFQQTGSIEMLEKLKNAHPYYEEFRTIQGIGPVTARRLGKYGIETRDELQDAINSGRIEEIPGIGPKTAENIKQNL